MAGFIPDNGLSCFPGDTFVGYLQSFWVWQIVLFKVFSFAPSKDLLWSHCTEADFDGYARQLFGSPAYERAAMINSDTSSELFPEVTFSGGLTTPNIIVGWGVMSDSPTPHLIAVEQFADSIEINGDGTILRITPRLTETDP